MRPKNRKSKARNELEWLLHQSTSVIENLQTSFYKQLFVLLFDLIKTYIQRFRKISSLDFLILISWHTSNKTMASHF